MMVYLTKRDAALNVQRYYLVCVGPTLLGEYSVTREWGRIAGHSRRMTPATFASDGEALRHAQQLVRRKLKRGYVGDGQMLARLEAGVIGETMKE
jgi:predicted DNA-binding WGR domain protein